MLPTPSTAHVSFATIYEPAEDSFLLLDTLSSATEISWLHARIHASSPPHQIQLTARACSVPLVVELGTGSGVVLAFLAAHARRIFGADVLALGIDINPNACRATAVTVQRALAEQRSGSIFLGAMCADLTDAMAPAEVDVLVFNPPYVPTEQLPRLPAYDSTARGGEGDQWADDEHLLSLSYAGGALGMETTDRLLVALPEVLSARGVAYVLLCAQNRPEEVKAWIRTWADRGGRGWCAETVGRSGKTGGWEKLEIVRIWQEVVARSRQVSCFNPCIAHIAIQVMVHLI